MGGMKRICRVSLYTKGSCTEGRDPRRAAPVGWHRRCAALPCAAAALPLRCAALPPRCRCAAVPSHAGK